METSKTLLYGLVLSGGKSTRMGEDKGLLHYHGLPQREYLYLILKTVCDEAYLSIRSEQARALDPRCNYITDRDEFQGPFNGILSAHAAFPDIAWLVFACDLPLLDMASLQQLIAERDPDKHATAMATQQSGLPEPLAAIWEPQGLNLALKHVHTTKNPGPRKFLLHADVKLVYPKPDRVLYNANSLAEYKFAKSILN